MSFKKIVLLALLALAFAIGFFAIIVKNGAPVRSQTPKPQSALEPFDGKLSIEAVDDLRVAGRKIVLCGVAFTKPQSIRAMATELARRDYQGLALTCKPVGKGTPCDGNVASKFGEAIVVQCLTSDGTDLAAKLAEKGILCGQPGQAGSTYKSCLSGS
ncbi:MAG: hypothetical protein E5X53_13410 [Mesorhizobium sp.]|uniref:hypothetical protein n=1 Tax=Mesorhizobium sp. TaxID=1871066 RepID=UPI0012197CAC|nr:hypothetical protein [Mesorhizobium sp.]TIP74929.1 MAG: hypothetical protein E5X55_06430 [Mesorhizobium sp.]TIQ12532.1 MAG: hypothetical protein E5X57_12650 [Mesorhizobium sp.]TIR51740.1 MAG: hypothetical protein E5X53_13410 [Mesorhizobium sp.]TJV96359.1 MAG: hypothetical protein E5X52_19180 [Mesorhizobium sp.]